MVARRARFNAVVWGTTGMVVRASAGQDQKGNGTQVLTHPDTAWTLFGERPGHSSQG